MRVRLFTIFMASAVISRKSSVLLRALTTIAFNSCLEIFSESNCQGYMNDSDGTFKKSWKFWRTFPYRVFMWTYSEEKDCFVTFVKLIEKEVVFLTKYISSLRHFLRMLKQKQGCFRLSQTIFFPASPHVCACVSAFSQGRLIHPLCCHSIRTLSYLWLDLPVVLTLQVNVVHFVAVYVRLTYFKMF